MSRASAQKNGRTLRGAAISLSKGLAEFAARRRQSMCNPFFAAACTSQKTLLRLQVWNLFAHGEQIMRAADCKPFVQKWHSPFWTVSRPHPPGCGHFGESPSRRKNFLAFSPAMGYNDCWLCRCDGMVDVADSKSAGGDSVWVRVPPPAPWRVFLQHLKGC